MVLTPRAEALRPRVRALLEQAERAFAPERPFVAATLRRSFTIAVTDHVLSVLGPALDREVRGAAPEVALTFRPTGADDAGALRDGGLDLAVGIYGELAPELRTRPLFTDRYVIVVRAGHPGVGKRLGLEEYGRLEHIQISPRGRPGGYVEDLLVARGIRRRVLRVVPYFLAAVQMVATTDYALMVSERLARALAPQWGLRVLEPPLALRPSALSLVWHPRCDEVPEHRWLRERWLAAAALAAPEVHAGARTRLDHGRPRGRG
jgi:DNA-binding transcriptional LysR family regulator